MLFKTVHLPAAYSTLPEDEAGANMHCSALLAILEDALTNCVILTDEQGVVGTALEAAGDNWPTKYAPRLRMLLKELRKYNRLVLVPAGKTSVPDVRDKVCQSALGIAAGQEPEAVLIPDRCRCNGVCELVKRGVRVGEYKISPFNDDRLHGQSRELGSSQLSKQEFEDEVLKPVLRYAKHVKLIDRLIGVLTLGAVRDGGVGITTVPENYQQTIRWMYEVFAGNSDPSRPRTFNVYTAIDDRTDLTLKLATVDALQDFAESVGTEALPLSIRLKLNRKSEKFPHDRFLITDQTALQVGRGFDLLDRQGRIRDTIVQQVRGQPYLSDIVAMDDATPAALLAHSLGQSNSSMSRAKPGAHDQRGRRRE